MGAAARRPAGRRVRSSWLIALVFLVAGGAVVVFAAPRPVAPANYDHDLDHARKTVITYDDEDAGVRCYVFAGVRESGGVSAACVRMR